MRHTREEVIKRTIQEFERLDHLVNNLTDEDWNRLLTRPETKDPWTVKDALAHITHWKADVVRKRICGVRTHSAEVDRSDEKSGMSEFDSFRFAQSSVVFGL